MVRDDPTLQAPRPTRRPSQLILSGMGELHLEVSVDKLQRDHGVQGARVGKPMVAYRQTLAKPVEFETRYIKQSGGRGKYAVINMQFEPLTQGRSRGDGTPSWRRRARSRTRTTSTSSTRSSAARCRREYIPSVEQGFRDGCVEGGQVRLPVRRHAGDAARRQVPRRGQLGRHVQAGRDRELPRRPGRRPASRCWSRS